MGHQAEIGVAPDEAEHGLEGVGGQPVAVVVGHVGHEDGHRVGDYRLNARTSGSLSFCFRIHSDLRIPSDTTALNLSRICSVPIVSLLRNAGSSSCRNIAVALIDTSNNTSYLYCSSGVEHQRVIAPKGTKHRLENHGGDSRKHVTASVMFDAAGFVIPPRLVYAGVRNRFKQLAKIPTTGITGEWKHSVSQNGYVNREIFLEILQDLDQSLTERNIKGCVYLGFHTSI